MHMYILLNFLNSLCQPALPAGQLAARHHELNGSQATGDETLLIMLALIISTPKLRISTCEKLTVRSVPESGG